MVYSSYIFLSYSSYTTALPPHTVNLCNILYHSKTSFATVTSMYYFFILVKKIETNKHLEESFYLPTNTWISMVVCLVQRLLDEHKESELLNVI